jgi:hypothetical protein
MALVSGKGKDATTRHNLLLGMNAEGIFMLERFYGATITISTGRVVPVRLIGEQHVLCRYRHKTCYME